MAGKKHPIPPRQEVDRLLRQLDQAPGLPAQGRLHPERFSPWNVSMKKPAVKRTIACSLAEAEKK